MNKKTLFTIIICLILMVSGYFLGTYLKNTIDNAKNNEEGNKEEEKTTDSIEDSNLFLNQLLGEWGTCQENSCYGIIVNKNDQDEYTYLPYVMWSEFGGTGTIQKVSKIEDDKYRLTIYFKAYDSPEITSSERTEEITIDFKDISSRTIYIDNTKYELVVGDREEFYQSKVNYQN